MTEIAAGEPVPVPTTSARAPDPTIVEVPGDVIGRGEVLAAFDHSFTALGETGRRLLVVEGPPGIGKSTLLREMRRRVMAAGGVAAVGEFGARAPRLRSSGLRGAVADIVAAMLALPEDDAHDWFFGLQDALGGPVEQFADVLPELASVSTGATVATSDSPAALRNRLRIAVLGVVRATARSTRPLLLTLDDFDQADGESMQIVTDALAGDADGLMIVAAAEPNALDRLPLLDDPLTARVQMTELDDDALARFVAATFAMHPLDVEPFAVTVRELVGGNPLAVLQFLQRAAAAGALSRDAETAHWHWDLNALRAVGVEPSDDELAVTTLHGIPHSETLQIAACLSRSFTIADLASASGLRSDEVAATISHALGRGILRPRAERAASGVFLEPDLAYMFVSPSIEEALRHRAPLELQVAAHRRFGQELLRSERDDDLIAAARHLNLTRSYAASADERMELAAIDAQAARRARNTAAFPVVRELADAAFAAFPPDADDRDHALVFEVHVLAAEAAWVAGDLASMKAFIDAARALRTTVVERAELTYLEMKRLVADELPAEAIAVGRNALAELGIRLPSNPSTRRTLLEFAGVRRQLRSKSDNALLAMPKATDTNALAAQKLLAEMFGPAYMCDPDLWPVLALRCLRLTLACGRAPVSPVAFAGYGLLLSVMGRYEEAARFGDLALALTEHAECRDFRPWTSFLYYDFIHHWTRPAADAIAPLRQAIREALVVGDLENAGFMTAVELTQSVSYGIPMPEIDARAAELSVYLKPYAVQFMLTQMTRQFAHNIMGHAPDHLTLTGDTAYDERVEVPAAADRHDVTALSGYHLAKLSLHFIYADFVGGLEHAAASEQYLAGMRGTVNVPAFHTANAIVRLRGAPNAPSTRRAVRRAQRGYRRWRRASPENYDAPALLIDAEDARARGDARRAEELYDEAIKIADRHGLLTTAALAREFCGDLHARQGRDHVASAYLASAVDAWASIGADGKVRRLRTDYAALLRATIHQRADVEAREIAALTDATDSDVSLEELLQRSMATVVRVTGAQRGALFVHDGTNVVPSAAFTGGTVSIAPHVGEFVYAASVVRYAAQAGRPVLIPDALASIHGRDEHLRADRIRSVLCVPVTRGGLRALVYVEHTSRDAFTAAHVETMHMLASHMVTAMENAQLERRLDEALRSQSDLVVAQSRFVPDQMLRALGRETLTAIEAGDAVVREMTLLYTDIRGYATIQEGLDPRHGIGFLNDYLRRMEPPIVAHGGFVDSYVGDGMIALFEPAADAALRAALAMRRIEREFGEARRERGLEPVRTGIALHTGNVVIGTFGGVNQLRCGVVGDTVNLASRLEGLTKRYGPLLVSGPAHAQLAEAGVYDLRRVGTFRVVGRSEPVAAWEVFDEDDPDTRSAKRAALPLHDAALHEFEVGHIAEAHDCFERLARAIPGDLCASSYRDHCAALLDTPLPDGWDGVVTLDHK